MARSRRARSDMLFAPRVLGFRAVFPEHGGRLVFAMFGQRLLDRHPSEVEVVQQRRASVTRVSRKGARGRQAAPQCRGLLRALALTGLKKKPPGIFEGAADRVN